MRYIVWDIRLGRFDVSGSLPSNPKLLESEHASWHAARARLRELRYSPRETLEAQSKIIRLLAADAATIVSFG